MLIDLAVQRQLTAISNRLRYAEGLYAEAVTWLSRAVNFPFSKSRFVQHSWCCSAILAQMCCDYTASLMKDIMSLLGSVVATLNSHPDDQHLQNVVATVMQEYRIAESIQSAAQQLL